MNLESTQDVILLRNCITVKIKELEQKKNYTNADFSTTANTIENYKKVLEFLNKGDIESVLNIFSNSIQSKDFSEFSKHISETPAKNIAQEYMNLTKTLMENSGSYSDKKFAELKKAFYKGNENLNPDTSNSPEYEEEPEPHSSVTYLTKDMEIALNKLNKLTRQNPKTMSASDFKSFATQFRDITLELGKSKFQQYFDEIGQTIAENGMQISYDPLKPAYKTDFTLLDSDLQETHLTHQENAPNSDFSSNYFQNLCYSYLEADKYSNIDENLLDANIITSKMDKFRDCYKKLDELMKKCRITISGNSLIYFGESEVEPTELDLEACNSEPKTLESENEIEI